jgi:hypothetical protein
MKIRLVLAALVLLAVAVPLRNSVALSNNNVTLTSGFCCGGDPDTAKPLPLPLPIPSPVK